MGATGWSFATMMRVLDKLRCTVQPVHARHRNQLCRDWVQACADAYSMPIHDNFNAEIAQTGYLGASTGFFSVSYNPDDGYRSSASVAYIHPILRGEEPRPNLVILAEAWVSKINLGSDGAVSSIDMQLKDGSRHAVSALVETVLCAGAIDTPRLMLLSGMGPLKQLSSLNIPVVCDIPGVGENLMDHPEAVIIWGFSRPVPPNQTTMDSDVGIFLRREAPNDAAARGPTPTTPKALPDGEIADVMMHCYQIPFTYNTARLGYPEPDDGFAFCMTLNIPRPRSRGRLYLVSADPAVHPALGFRYFTDEEGYDAATLVYGIKAARKVAEQEPFKAWIKREVAPGPLVRSDEGISEYARRAAHTVYHPAGTMRMGDVEKDALVVVDPTLRVRRVKKLRVCDASVFPTIPSINPMLTVMGVAERLAEMEALA
jgi:choline dehydrogenase-like flavoprotein